jgi:glycogen debranching enzyme
MMIADSAEPVERESTGEFSEYYIEAHTSLVDRALRTIKAGEVFAVFDGYGDCGTVPDSPEGVFYRDTRYLSRFALRLEGKRPLLLGSVIQDDNAALSVELTNPDLRPEEDTGIPRDTIAIDRTKAIWQGTCSERISFRNYGERERRLSLELHFDADFRDLFEVRGMKRVKRGVRTTEIAGPGNVVFRYEGLDGAVRQTGIRLHPAPANLSANVARYDLLLKAGERHSIIVTTTCEEEPRHHVPDFFAAYRGSRRAIRLASREIATVESSNDIFNELACRSASDLAMLTTETAHGPYPYAGIPWYCTVFGRDGIITALMLLWMNPSVAKGVLRYLAATQAKEFDPDADAQPGKILHEVRDGEMARLGEVPFRRYYGTVDATPLFVLLAGRYFERTGDRKTIEDLWPSIETALHWCDRYGDRDGDGFVEYFRETEQGLANQGWKDSYDSIFHADGSTAEGPIALCEVQGYVYAAKQASARLADALGKGELATRFREEAAQLKRRFEEAFWSEEIGTYALALDGEKRSCKVRSSNAGHTLFTGIALPERARLVAKTLLGQSSFSGWGIRTLAQGEPRFNPMSYHNGSIWPHDNALIAMGFAQYGMKGPALRVFEALFNVAKYQELRRLPELYCGFLRRPHRGPTAYPVACSPQAWAAATPFALVGACLGLEFDHERDTIRFNDPVLPAFLDEIVIRKLRFGQSCFDVRVYRHGSDATVNVLTREGSSRLVVVK